MVTSTPPIFRVITYSVGYGLIGDRRQIGFACLWIVQDHARIERDDLFRRNEQRIDVDFLNPALFDDQLAEAHQQVFQRGQIDRLASTKTFFERAVDLCSLH